MKVKFLKHSFYIFGYLTLNHVVYLFFLNFGRILAIGNLRTHRIFSTFKFFNTSFWLHIANRKKQWHNFRLAAAVVSKEFQYCPLKSLGSCMRSKKEDEQEDESCGPHEFFSSSYFWCLFFPCGVDHNVFWLQLGVLQNWSWQKAAAETKHDFSVEFKAKK